MVTEFVRGQKSQLSALTTGTDLYVGVLLEGTGEWDVSCFGLDGDGKLSDDSYFIFFNQPESPEKSIQKLGAQAGDTESFRVTLDRVPTKIERLAFCVATENASAAGITRGYVRIVAGGEEVARYSFSGADFGSERAIMMADIYQKSVWRFAAVGQGFSGGLSELIRSFGGEVADDEPEAPPAAAPGFAPPAGPPAAGPPGFAPPPGPPPAAPPPVPPQAPPPQAPPQQQAPQHQQSQPAAAGGLPTGVVAGDLPSQTQRVRPGAMISLEKYKEKQGQARWIEQGHKMVKVTLGQGPTVYAKRGSMVAYQGNIEFDYKGSGGLKQMFESRMTGQRLQLMTCKGQGEVFLADDAADLHVVDLKGQRLCINANNVLAFDSSLQTEIKRIESPGLPGGGMFHLEVGGQGSVVIMTHGMPVTLPTVGPTFADMNAVVAWTAGMRVSVSSQVRISRTIYTGVSGESAALQFMGMQGHFVVVQPYEV